MLDKEILDGFKQETKALLAELTEVVESLEEAGTGPLPAEKLSEFAQKIDRIMGAVTTMVQLDGALKPLGFVSTMAELCKKTGYQAARLNQPALAAIFAGFWADVIEVIDEAVALVDTPEKISEVSADFTPVLLKRLKWLSDKVAEASGGGTSTMLSQDEIEKLMKAGGG